MCSYAILFFTASDFTFITSHIHNWVLFLLWLCLFTLSGVTSPLFSSSILGTYLSGEFIFQCPIFLSFHTVHGVLKERILSGLSFPSPVVYVLSELSSMTRPSLVALHGMAHDFTELDKAVVHVKMSLFYKKEKAACLLLGPLRPSHHPDHWLCKVTGACSGIPMASSLTEWPVATFKPSW